MSVRNGIFSSGEILDGAPPADGLGVSTLLWQLLADRCSEATAAETRDHAVGDDGHDRVRSGLGAFGAHGKANTTIDSIEVLTSRRAVMARCERDIGDVGRGGMMSPSGRGALATSSILETGRDNDQRAVHATGSVFSRLDTGAHDGPADAGKFARTRTTRRDMWAGGGDEFARGSCRHAVHHSEERPLKRHSDARGCQLRSIHTRAGGQIT